MRGAGVVCLALLAGGASAQPFIEIRIDTVYAPAGSSSPPILSGGWFIFDAGAAPAAVTGTTAFFDLVAGAEYRYAADNPLRPGPTPIGPGDLARFRFEFFDFGSTEFWTLAEMRVSPPPAGVFSLSMTSLPDDPADYQAVGPNAEVGKQFESVRWTMAGGFEDGFVSYSVRLVDDPNPCAADLDANGILNLDDLDLFVAEFLGGCS